MNATPLENLLARLGDYKPSGKGFTGRCPAHEDRHPSLSVSETEDGTVLLKCHSGCTTEAVLAALQLELKDLFPLRHEANGRVFNSRKPKGKAGTTTFPTAAEAVAVLDRQDGARSAYWTYPDAGGAPVGLVVRWDRADGKDIRPVSLHGGSWRIAAMPAPRPLYQLPKLLQSTGRVLVVEGEKAAEAALALGLSATTSAGGANAATKGDWSVLAGRDVAILPDHDEPGGAYAKEVAAILMALQPPARVRIVELPGLQEHGDLVDYAELHRAAGLADTAIRAEIESLADIAEVLSADKTVQPKADRAPCKPILISLADVQPRPVSWLWRERVPTGKVSLLVGDPGLGKSLVTIDMAARVSRGVPWPDAPGETNPAGGVILLNAEDDIGDTMRPRLDAAGADVTRIQALQAVQRRADNDELAPPRSFSLSIAF